MDSDSLARISYSRRYQSRSDAYNGDEYDGDEDKRAEFMCPFCAEDFDMVGLCCHIDEDHSVSAKNGVCPICTKRVGSDLIRHLTGQHGSLLKVQRRRRLRRGGSNMSFSALRRELREGNLQSILGVGGASSPFLLSSSSSSSQTQPDPLLTSFIYNHTSALVESSTVPAVAEEEDHMDRVVAMSDEDMKEKAERCEFILGLVLSTFLDDNL